MKLIVVVVNDEASAEALRMEAESLTVDVGKPGWVELLGDVDPWASLSLWSPKGLEGKERCDKTGEAHLDEGCTKAHYEYHDEWDVTWERGIGD